MVEQIESGLRFKGEEGNFVIKCSDHFAKNIISILNEIKEHNSIGEEHTENRQIKNILLYLENKGFLKQFPNNFSYTYWEKSGEKERYIFSSLALDFNALKRFKSSKTLLIGPKEKLDIWKQSLEIIDYNNVETICTEHLRENTIEYIIDYLHYEINKKNPNSILIWADEYLHNALEILDKEINSNFVNGFVVLNYARNKIVSPIFSSKHCFNCVLENIHSSSLIWSEAQLNENFIELIALQVSSKVFVDDVLHKSNIRSEELRIIDFRGKTSSSNIIKSIYCNGNCKENIISPNNNKDFFNSSSSEFYGHFSKVGPNQYLQSPLSSYEGYIHWPDSSKTPSELLISVGRNLEEARESWVKQAVEIYLTKQSLKKEKLIIAESSNNKAYGRAVSKLIEYEKLKIPTLEQLYLIDKREIFKKEAYLAASIENLTKLNWQLYMNTFSLKGSKFLAMYLDIGECYQAVMIIDNADANLSNVLMEGLGMLQMNKKKKINLPEIIFNEKEQVKDLSYIFTNQYSFDSNHLAAIEKLLSSQDIEIKKNNNQVFEKSGPVKSQIVLSF